MISEPSASRRLLPLVFWVGVGLALVVLWLSGHGGRAWEIVQQSRKWPLFACLALGIALPVIHALRWKVAMAALGTQADARTATELTVTSSLINYASPGYLGAPTMAFLAKRTLEVPWSRSFTVLAFEQGLDALLLFILSVVALFIIGPTQVAAGLDEISATWLIVSWAVIAMFFVVAFLVRNRIRSRLLSMVEAFRTLFGVVDWSAIWLLTALKWLAQAAVVALLLHALRLPTSATSILSLSSLPLLAGQLVPLPGGVGVREAVIVSLTGALAISSAGLLGLAILQRVLLVLALPLAAGALRLLRSGSAV